MNKSILVIDDEEAICYAFQKFFGARGWRVDVAACAQEGLASYQMHQQDVVFLDVRLPDRSGIDLLKDLDEESAPFAADGSEIRDELVIGHCVEMHASLYHREFRGSDWLPDARVGWWRLRAPSAPPRTPTMSRWSHIDPFDAASASRPLCRPE